MADDIVTEKELAKMLGERLRGKPFHERTLWAWRRRKIGPPARLIGGSYFYHLPAVEAWLKGKDRKAA